MRRNAVGVLVPAWFFATGLAAAVTAAVGCDSGVDVCAVGATKLEADLSGLATRRACRRAREAAKAAASDQRRAARAAAATVLQAVARGMVARAALAAEDADFGCDQRLVVELDTEGMTAEDMIRIMARVEREMEERHAAELARWERVAASRGVEAARTEAHERHKAARRSTMQKVGGAGNVGEKGRKGKKGGDGRLARSTTATAPAAVGPVVKASGGSPAQQGAKADKASGRTSTITTSTPTSSDLEMTEAVTAGNTVSIQEVAEERAFERFMHKADSGMESVAYGADVRDEGEFDDYAQEGVWDER